jgi:hypothetical protein
MSHLETNSSAPLTAGNSSTVGECWQEYMFRGSRTPPGASVPESLADFVADDWMEDECRRNYTVPGSSPGGAFAP